MRQDSFRTGKYTGLEDQGLFALVSIDYQNRPRYDENRTELPRDSLNGEIDTIVINLRLSSRLGALSLERQPALDKLTSDQAGVSFQSGAARVDQVVDPARQWLVLHGDRADTGGVNLTYKPATRFQFGFDVLLSKVTSDVDVSMRVIAAQRWAAFF